MQEARVPSLVVELGSHMPHGATKKIYILKKKRGPPNKVGT